MSQKINKDILTEKQTKIILKKVNVIFEQSDFLCTKFSKQ